MSVLLDIEMPKTARDCIFNQPAPFRGDFCIINNVCTFPDGCPLHEQKTGKWESIEDVVWYCSECKYAHSRSNYCPHCGAKMEE